MKAQIAANQKGSLLIQELFVEYGTKVVQRYIAAIQDTAESAVKQYLEVVAKIYPEPLKSADYVHYGTQIHLNVTIDLETGCSVFDFPGTDRATYGNRSAPQSLVFSAIIYTLREMLNEHISLNQCRLAPTKVIIPENTIISLSYGATVFPGNSQRVSESPTSSSRPSGPARVARAV